MAYLTKVDKKRFGQWALVTGASSGIGKEFARQLAASGFDLVLVARRVNLLEQLGQELQKKYGIQYCAIGLDLTDANFIETLENATRHLDIGLVVSGAGTPVPGEFLDIERDVLLKGVQLKIVAHMTIAHHFGKRLVERGGGGLLLISSTGGLQGIPYVANNAAMEAYVLSLGEALHIELKSSNVTVTTLLPGPTDTPAMQSMGLTPDDLPMKPMSPQQCVAEGLAALNANRATHIAGRMNRLMAGILPRSLSTQLNGIIIGKTFAGKH